MRHFKDGRVFIVSLGQLPRRVAAPLGWALLGLLVGALAMVYLWSQTRPALSFWHEGSQYHPGLAELPTLEQAQWADYVAHEQQQFASLDRLLAKRAEQNAGPSAPWHRFSPVGAANPNRLPQNWNRSFQLAPMGPLRFSAVLIHGLSDSPYSMRTLAQDLANQGGQIYAPRLPGHGLMPGQLLNARWEQQRTVVAMAVAEARKHQVPLLLVGYSNGAALAVDYTLQALADEGLAMPAGIVLISPALRVSKLAAFAQLQRLLGHLPGLSNLAWVDILPEYDPFKYNSFPVHAGQQIYELTATLQQRLRRLKGDHLAAQFPRLLVFQSVVDATVAADAALNNLLVHVATPDGPAHQLVLFDVNHTAAQQGYLKSEHQPLLQQLNAGPLPFDYVRVGNDTSRSVNRYLRARYQMTQETHATELAWPERVYSLSHVALPYPPEDPLYGDNDDPATVLHLGSGGGLGERGAFIVSMEQLSRLRYNPFYPIVRQTLADFVERTASAETAPQP